MLKNIDTILIQSGNKVNPWGIPQVIYQKLSQSSSLLVVAFATEAGLGFFTVVEGFNGATDARATGLGAATNLAGVLVAPLAGADATSLGFAPDRLTPRDGSILKKSILCTNVCA